MLFLSDGILPLSGYKKEELINNNKLAYNNIIAPEYRKYVLNATNEGLKNNEHYHLEYQIICKSGEKKWVGEQGFGIRGNNNEIIFIEGYIQDISEKKQLEEELKERSILQEKMNMFVNTAPGGLCTIKMDQQGNISIPFVSESWEEMHGLSFGNINKNPLVLAEYIIEPDLENFKSSFVNSAQNLDYNTTVYKYNHPSKGLRWLKINSIPIKDETGNIYWNGFVSDITAEKQSGNNLIKSEERFRSALENIPDVITIYDKNLKIIYLNDATSKITGMKALDFIGKKEEDIWPPEVYEPYMPTLLKARETKRPQQVTTEIKIPGKSPQSLHINYVPILNAKGEIREIMGITQNLTDNKIKEQAILSLERRFRETLENVQLIAVLLDRDGNITFCNDYFLKITGYVLEEVLGNNWFDIFIDKEVEKIKDIFFSAIKTGKLKPHHENWIRIKNGDHMLIHFNNTLLRDLGGNIIGATSIGEDITQRRNAEIALKQSEEKFSKAFEASPNIFIITKYPSGEIIETNNSFIRILGYTPKEYMGKTTLDINLWDEKTEREKYFHELETTGKVNNFNAKIRLKSGEVLHFLLSSTFIELELGKCILAIAHDITELKQSQIKIENEKLRLRTLIETIPDLIWLKDSNGVYLTCNHEFELFFGAKESEIVGKTDYDYFPKELADFFRKHDKAAEKANKPTINFENVTYASDGRKVYLETIKTPMFDIDGQLIGILGIARDITEWRNLNENLENLVKERTQQLEIANKDLEAFAYSISHDLRAPLRHINGYAKLLNESIDQKNTETERYYLKIRESSIKMATMIDDLLKFSRLGRKTLQLTNVNLNELINQIIIQFEPEIKDRNIEWIIGNLPTIEGDKNLIHLVFENLISNAIKFTRKREHAVIEINRCKKNRGEYNIYIKDNGVGFDMAYADKLFNVFQRLHTESEFEGTGIGLANIKQIITKHSGKIWAEGELDKGATFFISI